MNLKVTDRRKFSNDGQLLEEDPAVEEQEAQAGQESSTPPRPEAPSRMAESAGMGSAGPAADTAYPASSAAPAGAIPESSDHGHASPAAKVDFQSFVYFLYMSALQELGIPTREGAAPQPADLERARFFVDVLELLEGKTEGNLEPGETKLLEEALYNIRLQYLGVSKGSPS